MRIKLLKINSDKYLNMSLIKNWHIEMIRSSDSLDTGSFVVYADDIFVKNFSFSPLDSNKFDSKPLDPKIYAMTSAEKYLRDILEEYL